MAFSLVAAFMITIGTIGGGIYAVEGHFAKEVPTSVSIKELQEDLIMVSNRIDSMKLEDELLLVKKEIFALEERWGEKFKEEHGRYYHSIEELLAFMPREYKERYLERVDRKEYLEKEIEKKNKKRESD